MKMSELGLRRRKVKKEEVLDDETKRKGLAVYKGLNGNYPTEELSNEELKKLSKRYKDEEVSDVSDGVSGYKQELDKDEYEEDAELTSKYRVITDFRELSEVKDRRVRAYSLSEYASEIEEEIMYEKLLSETLDGIEEQETFINVVERGSNNDKGGKLPNDKRLSSESEAYYEESFDEKHDIREWESDEEYYEARKRYVNSQSSGFNPGLDADEEEDYDVGF